jgi:hypothetical protein
MIQFVANYDDLSTDKGYQFRFHCDKCGNGYMSRFHTSKIGLAGSVLRAAGSIFGGWELAASQAHAKTNAARLQVFEKALQQNYANDIDMSADAQIAAPEPRLCAPSTPTCRDCGADVGTAKFCPECGKPTAPAKPHCPSCNLQLEKPAKFCPECGTKVV